MDTQYVTKLNYDLTIVTQYHKITIVTASIV